MSILDARQIEPGTEFRTDICIVGAGAAGITVAKEMLECGRDVCLVESGGFQPEENTQNLYDIDSIGYPVRENFMSRARYYGGSCNLWAGRSMRLLESDTSPRDWVTDSGWPLAHTEITRYYPAAARTLRLPDIEQFDWSSYADRMSDRELELFSGDPFQPKVSLWAKRPMRFGTAYRSRFEKSKNLRLFLHASITGIVLNAEGTAVEALEAATLTGRRFRLRAHSYVLACGGMENARLLLVSRDALAAGIGNGHDLVGRFFMDHPRSVYGRVRLSGEGTGPISFLRGRPLPDGKVQLGIGLTREFQQREGLLNHYATLEAEFSQYTQTQYEFLIRFMKVLLRKGYAGNRWDIGHPKLAHIPGMIYLLTPKELMPHFLYRWNAALKRAIPSRKNGSCVVVYFCEQPPDPESRVTLSRERDLLGMNKLVLNWKLSSEVSRTVLRLQDLLRERLEASGIGMLEPGREEIHYTDASHHMGTTRMSAGPRTGVVDTDCQVHGVSNLFIAGSSVFPSVGHANPTLTIVALALRLSGLLRKR